MVRHWTPKPAIICSIRSSPTGGNFFFAVVVKSFEYKLWKTRMFPGAQHHTDPLLAGEIRSGNKSEVTLQFLKGIHLHIVFLPLWSSNISLSNLDGIVVWETCTICQMLKFLSFKIKAAKKAQFALELDGKHNKNNKIVHERVIPAKETLATIKLQLHGFHCNLILLLTMFEEIGPDRWTT